MTLVNQILLYLRRIPGSSWAFEQAKTNLVNKYLLVGVTEQMEEFVAILEATLPMYFKGALQLYRQGNITYNNTAALL